MTKGDFLKLDHWSLIGYFKQMKRRNQKCLRSGLWLMGKIQRLWTEVRQMGGEVTLHTMYAFLSNTKAVKMTHNSFSQQQSASTSYPLPCVEPSERPL